MASTCSMSSHHLNQCQLIVNWTIGNKVQWNLIPNTTVFNWRKWIWNWSRHQSVEIILCAFTDTDTKRWSYWWPSHHWLHPKLSFRRPRVQPVMWRSSMWQPFGFSGEWLVFTTRAKITIENVDEMASLYWNDPQWHIGLRKNFCRYLFLNHFLISLIFHFGFFTSISAPLHRFYIYLSCLGPPW